MRKVLFASLILIFSGCMASGKVVIPKINENEYASSNAVIVFDSTYINAKASGAYTKRQHVLVKILTMKGKADYSSASFSYTTKYGKVKVKFARVIKKDGRVVKVKKDNIKDVKMPAFGKFFMPSVRMVKITFPDVERGDAIEYEVEEITDNPPMEGNFDDMIIFENTEPVISQYYELRIPKEVHYKIYNDPEGVIKFRKLKNRYIWYVKDEKPLIREPMMPPLPDVGKKVLLSTVSSWKKWSVWYWNLVKDKLSVNDTMKMTMDSLLSGAPSRLDTMKRLFYFVSNKVRYVATTMNGKKLGYEPFPAPKTFRQKYGVCRDKAALLVAMYRYLGIDAYPVLTNPMIKIEKEIPADQFNHAIVAVKEGSKYMYIDPTAENTPVFLPFYEQGKGVLVCTPEGEDLEYTPLLPPDSNSVISYQRLVLDTLGNVKASTTMHGAIIDQQFRMVVKKVPMDRLKNMFQMSLQGLGKEASLDTIYYSNPDDFDTPFTFSMGYSVKGFALKSGKKYIFSLANQNMSLNGGSPFSLQKRSYPLYLSMPIYSENTVVIYLPKGYKVKELLKPYKAENDFVSFESSCQTMSDSIVCVNKSTFKKPLIPPEHYVEAKKLYDDWMKDIRARIILEKEAK